MWKGRDVAPGKIACQPTTRRATLASMAVKGHGNPEKREGDRMRGNRSGVLSRGCPEEGGRWSGGGGGPGGSPPSPPPDDDDGGGGQRRSGGHHRSSRSPHRPHLKLRSYDGITETWENYRAHFERIQRLYDWDDEEAAAYLNASLKGNAASCINTATGGDVDVSLQRLCHYLHSQFGIESSQSNTSCSLQH